MENDKDIATFLLSHTWITIFVSLPPHNIPAFHTQPEAGAR